MYDKILYKMNESGIKLVDNQDFLNFFTEETNPTLSEESRKVLLSTYGASPITDDAGLRAVLNAMFDERVDRQLNFIVLPGIFFTDVTTCS